MKRWLIGVLLGVFVVGFNVSLTAEDKPGEKDRGEKKEKKEGERKARAEGGGAAATAEVTISGRIEKKQWDRDGKSVTAYFLVDAEGRRTLLSGMGERGKGELELPAGVNLADYVGAEVKITGATVVRLTRIARIERTGGGDAPKAPAAAPAAGDKAPAKEATPAVW